MTIIIAIVLGSLGTILAAMLGYSFYKVLMMNNKLNQVDRDLQEHMRDIFETSNNTESNLYNEITDIDKSLRSYIDSRFDKLEQKIKN